MNTAEIAQKCVIVKDNRMYQHKLARFYYTTYDVRRSEDVINPRTSHSNVMLLSSSESETNKKDNLHETWTHPFLYARVIGIYHVNVVYTGPGRKDYESMRFDFLHVRWFQLEPVSNSQRSQGEHSSCTFQDWGSMRLDRLFFPPMAEKSSFGLVDPALILRGCHVIPAFSSGKRYLDGCGLSKLSKDSDDWKLYCINRYDCLAPFIALLIF